MYVNHLNIKKMDFYHYVSYAGFINIIGVIYQMIVVAGSINIYLFFYLFISIPIPKNLGKFLEMTI